MNIDIPKLRRPCVYFHKAIYSILISMIFLSGCLMPGKSMEQPADLQERYAKILSTLSTQTTNHEELEPTAAILQQTPIIETPENENTEIPSNLIYLHQGLPESLISSINLETFLETEDESKANVSISLGSYDANQITSEVSQWVYVLTAPFYTPTDNVTFESIKAFWEGNSDAVKNFSEILVTSASKSAFSIILGKADETIVRVVGKEEMEQAALSDKKVLAIMPFEDLNNHWKVIRLDNKSPIDDNFEIQDYPLIITIWVDESADGQIIDLPASNYDPNLKTVLIMTGVTALTRATAHRMEINGNQFPGQDIRDWLMSADLTHISNEVPFAANCPAPDPNQKDLIFCSSPDRIELLEYVGTDIVELTGNHLLDYGIPAINLTLEMYEERDWLTYAGGWNLLDAKTPARITHNGNQLAFIGCNPVGPPNVWATATKPGAAPCEDYNWMVEEIKRLRAEGYLPIVTMQYAEDYTDYPGPQMKAHFEMLAEAGAVVVNGSQAHTPKIMGFQNERFLHYGLGNLFFDQMEVYYSDVYMPGTREEFIDRLIFYNGELISIELLTAMLEDYARPRPMTSAERESFLTRIFSTAIDELLER
jgi:poly-gamma-glutamate synthesis protein (capsule biosynthesis protein)